MCGIAAIVFGKPASSENLTAMANAMEHRGPDGFGYLVYEAGKKPQIKHNHENPPVRNCQVGLAHRRLSILDLSDEGLQPMRDSKNSISVSYNGEIFNYVELKQELTRLGHIFRTTSDTEVLLKAYAQWGPECVCRFNGMWAFILLDEVARRVVISRDRYGIKPLFFTRRNGNIYFASEIKALTAVPGVSLEPNEGIVSRFLLSGATDFSEESFFVDVFRFPAAHSAILDLDSPSLEIKPRRYWNFPEETFRGSEEEAIQQFRGLFLDAVSVHSRSDVAVGTCLSGGLDSSSIVCACEYLRSRGEIPSYSHQVFGYTPSEEIYSEAPFMKSVVEATGANMHYVEISQDDFVESISKIVSLQDEPFASTSIAVQWAVFRKARAEGITVMLDGQGADEILGGYHSYFSSLANIYLKKKNLLGFFNLKRAYEKELGAFPISLFEASVRLTPSSILSLSKKIRNRFRTPIKSYFIQDALSEDLFSASLPQGEMGGVALDSLNHILEDHVSRASVPALLRYEDRNSMGHSIEARVPFLDHRLVDFLFLLPSEWKISGASTKNILRRAMKGILPDKVRNRKDKMGFLPSPGLTYHLIEKADTDLLENRTYWERRWFNEDLIRSMAASKDTNPNIEYPLWRVINTRLWARCFFS